jgi:hypothetical protein
VLFEILLCQVGSAAGSWNWIPRGNIRIWPNAPFKTEPILLEAIPIGNTVPYFGSEKAKHLEAEGNAFQGVSIYQGARNLIKGNSDS